AMLGWMRQIAREIREAAKEGTLPKSLSLGHVWITADHRALLLDAPWQPAGTAADAPLSAQAPSAIQACQHLLLQMMQACPHWSRPLHSDSLLTSLQKASIERFTHLLGLLNVLRRKKPALSQKVRESVVVLFFFLTPLLSTLSAHWGNRANETRWAQAFPSLPPLPRVLTEMAAFHPGRPYAPEAVTEIPHTENTPSPPSTKIRFRTSTSPLLALPAGPLVSCQFRKFQPHTPESDALSTHLRGHYASLLDASGKLTIPYLQLPHPDLETIRAVLHSDPNRHAPDAQSLAEADHRIAEFLAQIPRLGGIPLGWKTFELLFSFHLVLGAVILVTALFQCLSILAMGSPALMRLGGTACVSLGQRPAGRLRMLARWALLWIPAWGLHTALETTAMIRLGGHSPLLPLIGAALLPLLIVCTSLFPRNRCLLDRLTGIWKVQR
ncbi:MAG: hypothetical protein RLZZ399_2020, partial [Verrucomicrobiota bacterium]